MLSIAMADVAVDQAQKAHTSICCGVQLACRGHMGGKEHRRVNMMHNTVNAMGGLFRGAALADTNAHHGGGQHNTPTAASASDD
jgi:hypothetical protein